MSNARNHNQMVKAVLIYAQIYNFFLYLHYKIAKQQAI